MWTPKCSLFKFPIVAGLLFFSAIFESHAANPSRVAFVVGIENYLHAPKLENPVADAKAVSEILELSGFKVSSHFNIDQTAFLQAFDRFLADAERADVVLVYFAGHGVQIDAKNYLIPKQARSETIFELVSGSVDMDQIYQRLGRFDNFKIVLLDACQNNPFVESHEVTAGLAPVSVDLSRFLVGYAAQPGNVAFDGVGEHSPFASALLSHMPTTGLELLPLLSRVNLEVQKTTGGQQSPYVYYSIKPDFFFFEGESDYRDIESLFWQVASASNDASLINLYKDRFPEGKFVDDIEDRNSSPDTGEIRNLKSFNLEESIVHLFLKTRERDVANYYLSNFPTGEYRSYFEDYTDEGTRGEDVRYDYLCRTYATHPNDSTPGYPGVSYKYLLSNSSLAVEACRNALSLRPENAHIMVLLARSLAASGELEQALDLYHKSATLDDHRAIVSLGLLYETGSGVRKDIREAERLYERGARLGSPDAAINLAAMLLNGSASKRDPGKAETLLTWAMELGAPRAAYNLGVLKVKASSEGHQALDYFVEAGVNGFARGYLAAADLLDNGKIVATDHVLAAEYLLRAVAVDDGEAQLLLNARTPRRWSRDVIREMQLRLEEAGLYRAEIDGLSGPQFREALAKWRSP